MSSVLRNPRLQGVGSGLRNSTAGTTLSHSYQQPDLDSYGGLSSSSGGIPNSIGKVFVGGLSWDTTNDGLRAYFSKYGEVVDAVIMRDRASGRSRGFGFVTFTEEIAAERVSLDTHVLDGRTIEAKRAVSREEMAVRGSKTKKVFVGGLAMTVGEEEFKSHFEQFGPVSDAQIMVERDSGRPRGFGFVTFDDEDSVEKVLLVTHELGGKIVEVKKAEPKRSLATSSPSVPTTSSSLRSSTSSIPTQTNTSASAAAAAANAAGANTGFFGPYLTNPLMNQAYVNALDRSLFNALSQDQPGFPGGLGLAAGAGYYGSGLGLGLGMGMNGQDDPLAFYGSGAPGSGSPFTGGLGNRVPGGGQGSNGMGRGMSPPVGPIGSGKPREPSDYGYFSDPNQAREVSRGFGGSGLDSHYQQGFGSRMGGDGGVENSRLLGTFNSREGESFESGGLGGIGGGGGNGIPLRSSISERDYHSAYH